MNMVTENGPTALCSSRQPSPLLPPLMPTIHPFLRLLSLSISLTHTHRQVPVFTRSFFTWQSRGCFWLACFSTIRSGSITRRCSPSRIRSRFPTPACPSHWCGLRHCLCPRHLATPPTTPLFQDGPHSNAPPFRIGVRIRPHTYIPHHKDRDPQEDLGKYTIIRQQLFNERPHT